MITKLLLVLAVGHLMLSSVVNATNHTAFLEEAMEYLVDYTATESGYALDSLGINKRVTKIAREQFDAKIGKVLQLRTMIWYSRPCMLLRIESMHACLHYVTMCSYE